jgi:TolB-like protein/DNA-binding winged helix-turn-helix (wHTH) protein
MNAGRASKVVCFSDFQFDLWAGELSRNGIRIKVPLQSIQLLELLVGRPGEVVTRAEVQKKLWPNSTIVEFEHSINTAMNRLRQALGDSADSPRFIETLPKRGYRFMMSVETLLEAVPAAGSFLEGSPISVMERSGQPDERPRRWPLALAGGAVSAVVAVLLALNVAGLRDRVEAIVGPRHAVPVRKIESIAVLPLQNFSGDPKQEYLADGMTEALISDLGKIALLRVISRTSAMHYKGTNKRLPEIARELNVDAIFEGSVHRSGNRVRITTQLFQASPEKQIWSQRYERDLRDVLSLQGEVARAVAQEIRVALTPVEQLQLSRVVPVDPEAHELYLKGRYFWNKRSEEAVKRASITSSRRLERTPAPRWHMRAWPARTASWGPMNTFLPKRLIQKQKPQP